MKKFLAIMAILLLMATPVFAGFEKEKLAVGVEYSNLDYQIDAENSISVGFGGSSLGAAQRLENVEVDTTLAVVSYAFSEYFTPYALLGVGSISFDNVITGYSGSTATELARLGFESGSSFAWGFGAKGTVIQYKGFDLGYDARLLKLSGMEDDTSVSILSGTVIEPVAAETNLTQWDITIPLGYTVKFDKKFLQSIRPFVGYNYSNVGLTLENTMTAPMVTVQEKNDLNASLHSAVLGVDVKINNYLSLGAGGLVGDKEGFLVQAKVNF